MEQVNSLVNTLMAWVTLYGVKIIVGLVIFFVGRLIATKLRDTAKKTMTSRAVDQTLVKFTSSLLYYALLAFATIAALGQVGIQTASFVAVVGAAGLAVGLAMQGSLANFAAGVLIIIFKPFRIGDFVELAGSAGAVESILIFTTELKTPDNKKVIVPNAAVLGGVITNYSAHPTRRVDLVVSIGYQDDIDQARRVLQELVADDERILKEPAPVIAVIELADSGVNFNVRPWVKTPDYWGVYCDLTEAVKKRFDQEGISIPYPQQDVHLHTVTS
jgi:small conductance mechanosensitive channel